MNTTRYKDTGHRTPKQSVGNDFLEYFHPTQCRTFDEICDAIITSGWKPPGGADYKGKAKQAVYIRGYLSWLVKHKYLKAC